MKKFAFLFTVLGICSVLPTLGQDWHAGDTLKTAHNDSIRISDFRDNTINYTGQDLVDAAFPNSWPLFGTKARMAIGGYVRLDYIQDFDGAYDRFQYEIQNVPVAGDGRPDQSGYMNIYARESRFNFDIRSISESGRPYRIFIEMDFYNLAHHFWIRKSDVMEVAPAKERIGQVLFGVGCDDYHRAVPGRYGSVDFDDIKFHLVEDVEHVILEVGVRLVYLIDQKDGPRV